LEQVSANTDRQSNVLYSSASLTDSFHTIVMVTNIYLPTSRYRYSLLIHIADMQQLIQLLVQN